MNLDNLKGLIYKIYNEGLFQYENEQMKSEEMMRLENSTKYKDVNELFFSDLAPDYVYDTIVLYEKMTSKIITVEQCVDMIDELINRLGDMEEYKLDLYCRFLGEHLGINNYEVYDNVFELSEEGYSAKEIYDKLKN